MIHRKMAWGFGLRIMGAAIASSCVLGLACQGPEPMTKPEKLPCQEDEPCWDCETMGNLICGMERGTTVTAG